MAAYHNHRMIGGHKFWRSYQSANKLTWSDNINLGRIASRNKHSFANFQVL